MLAVCYVTQEILVTLLENLISDCGDRVSMSLLDGFKSDIRSGSTFKAGFHGECVSYKSDASTVGHW